jgi:integrase
MGRVTLSVPYLRLKRSGWYWEPSRKLKRLGFTPHALGTDEVAALARAREINARVHGEAARAPFEPLVRKETVACIIRHCYLPSDQFTRLSKTTKVGYRRALMKIERWAGDQPVRAVTRKAIKAWQRALEESTSRLSAAATLRVLRIVMGVAVDEGIIAINPALKLRLATPNERDRVWMDPEIERFCATASSMNRRSIATAVQLALWLGQRQADVLKLAWSKVDSARDLVFVKQQKVGKEILVPIAPELRTWLEATPRASATVVSSEITGTAYGEDNFRSLFAEIRAAAGLDKELQFMDLRRSAATRLAQAGCSISQIMSITGHKTLQVVGRYVRPDETMARSAIEKLLKNREGGKN